MLRRITRNKQVTIPKELMERLHLHVGDYVIIDFENNSILIKPVVIEEFSTNDYKKLALKLNQLKTEPGTTCKDSTATRKHLKHMMG